jgi:phosphoribosylformylglycinamidine synthase
MFKATVTITLRPSILDTQGKAVQHALQQLGYENAQSVRIGKHIEMMLDTTDEAVAKQNVHDACEKLLANTVMEDFSYTLEAL